MAIKLFQPYVSWKSIANTIRVLRSGYLAEGEEVKLFEHEFSYTTGFPYVCALNSGTAALELAYELSGIKAGDEVITPILTCTATNLPLVRRGAKIIFADIDTDLNVNIHDIKKKITPKTKAIVFVHFGGNNRGLRELLGICSSKGITLIEDAAQAVGSEFWGQADFTCTSLQAIKTLTAGDGGFLMCKRKEDHEKAKRLRWFGYDREMKQKYCDMDITEAGYKYHMNNISAAIGRGNLESLPKLIEHRKKLAEIYRSYGLFAHAWLAGGFTNDYEGLKASYADENIEIGQHHYRNDKYTVFKDAQSDCPTIDKLEHSYFFIPFHHGVAESDAHKIGQIYKNHG